MKPKWKHQMASFLMVGIFSCCLCSLIIGTIPYGQDLENYFLLGIMVQVCLVLNLLGKPWPIEGKVVLKPSRKLKKLALKEPCTFGHIIPKDVCLSCEEQKYA